MTMWIESFRPQTLDDIVGQEHIVKRLRYMIDELHTNGNDGAWPHMMFAGPAGTGKTSVAVAMMRSLFGEDWAMNYIELNASDSRSINDIRGAVKDFARKGVMGAYLVDGKPTPIPFNVVFLDECDNLTPDAQAALRRIMERFSKQTRFVLSCNYPHQIIDPIKDRCAFSDTRFTPIPPKTIYRALKGVVEREGVSITPEALKAVSLNSKGSMRKALNFLFSVTRVPGEATIEDVTELLGELDDENIGLILSSAYQAQDASPSKRHNLLRRVDSMIDSIGDRGVSGVEILDAIYRRVSEDPDMPNAVARNVYRHLGESIFQCSASQDDLLAVKVFMRKVAHHDK
jgi:replication factor C small subunit